MPTINIWAACTGARVIPTLRDARLRSSSLSYPSGDTTGQAGWDLGMQFTNLMDLSTKLTTGTSIHSGFCGNWFEDCGTITHGQINRFALHTHGLPGEVYWNGSINPVTADNVFAHHSLLHQIGLFTNSSSIIFLMACLAGRGENGTRLLTNLSSIWPNRRIVGFSTVGYIHPGSMMPRGEHLIEPGMRDTNASALLFADPTQFDRQWSDFAAMPWASETSPHAKVVVNRRVIKWPVDELSQ